jgi:hypothetical protein
MGKRKHHSLVRPSMHAASFWCLLSYAMWATVPPPDVVNDVMLSRILAGSSPISTGDDDGLPFDWVLLAQSVAVQSPLWLAMIGIVLRREVAKWAKAPYIPGHGTDFFAWNDSVFEAHFCFTKDDVCRMRRALEIPDVITHERPRTDRPGSRLISWEGDWAFCVFLTRMRSAGTLLQAGLVCQTDLRVVSLLHLHIQKHIYNYKLSPQYPLDNNLPPGGRALLTEITMWRDWLPELQETGVLNGIPPQVRPSHFPIGAFPFGYLHSSHGTFFLSFLPPPMHSPSLHSLAS